MLGKRGDNNVICTRTLLSAMIRYYNKICGQTTELISQAAGWAEAEESVWGGHDTECVCVKVGKLAEVKTGLKQ